MVDHGRLFFGSQNGTVYALNASTGSVVWTYKAAGAVKASPTLANGVLYFGDYSGHVQAISEQTGRRLWISGSGGALLGSGTFYSTAAVIYGRVFLGNTDGRVYAYDAGTGALDWAVQTGAYVYASPAVTNTPGLGPSLYIGSYNGTFYALNARSGRVSWQFDAHGRISGSATIIGRTVFFADLGDHRTYGLGISTGRVLFEKDTGSFDPVISDGRDIFLTGTTGLYALEPR
jgi:outer membrane protein assembly factor BamB